jgi:hypothetical protein
MKNATSMTKADVRTFTPTLPEVFSEKGSEILGAVLPEQFYIPAKESHERWNGARGLMLAVLQEAVQSYLKYGHSTTQRGRRLFVETRAWFWNDDLDYLFSFESVCAYLQLDPAYIRRGLEAQIQRQRSRPPLARVAYRRATVSVYRSRLARAA